MAEWLKAAVLKTVVGAILPGVRIPLSPPLKPPQLGVFLFSQARLTIAIGTPPP